MSMSREQAKVLLGENATDEQITALLNKFHEEQKELKDKLANVEKTNADLTAANKDLQGYKTKIDEIEKEKMSEAEKIALERKELAAKNREATMMINSIKAKSILVEAGISGDRLDSLVANIVKETEADTIAAATLLAQELSSIKENTAKATREELANLDVKPNPSNKLDNSKPMTRETFLKMSQKEQTEFVKEHPEEFYNL